jgi:hypothetical protein
MRVPLEFIHFYVTVPKTATKKVFRSSDLLRKGHSLRGHALYKGPKLFFIIWGLWASKDAEFNIDFKNAQNAPKKSYSNLSFDTQKPHIMKKKNLDPYTVYR